MNKRQSTGQYICPICGQSEATKLRSVCSSAAAQHFCLRERDEIRFHALRDQIEKLWECESCDVVRCDTCSFSYAWPYVAGDACFYELAYDQNSYPAWKWEFDITLQALKPLLQPSFRVLEIGSGDGAFVRCLMKFGVKKENVLCTEYSPHGRLIIERFGIRCMPLDVRGVEFDHMHGSFNAICLFQVLEHLDRLDELFVRLRALLREGGSVFLAVPNHKRIEFNEAHGALLDMPPNHVGRWNRECFQRMAMKHGFKLEAHAIERFEFLSAWKQLAYHRFLRGSQASGSICNRVHSMRHRQLRKSIEVLSVTALAAYSLPLALRMSSEMGDSQWAHLKKR